MKFYQVAEKIEGKMVYDMAKLKHLIDLLHDGQYVISFQRANANSTVKDYRACYFAKIDMLGMEVGQSRYEMHELVKDNVLTEMMDELPDLFEGDVVSTASLALNGWPTFLERFDLWAFTNYNVILQ